MPYVRFSRERDLHLGEHECKVLGRGETHAQGVGPGGTSVVLAATPRTYCPP